MQQKMDFTGLYLNSKNVPQLSFIGKNWTFDMSSLKDMFTEIKGSDFK